MSECGCRPGSEANGWHERRSAACEKAELAAWGWALSWHRNNSLTRARDAT